MHTNKYLLDSYFFKQNIRMLFVHSNSLLLHWHCSMIFSFQVYLQLCQGRKICRVIHSSPDSEALSSASFSTSIKCNALVVFFKHQLLGLVLIRQGVARESDNQCRVHQLTDTPWHNKMCSYCTGPGRYALGILLRKWPWPKLAQVGRFIFRLMNMAIAKHKDWRWFSHQM